MDFLQNIAINFKSKHLRSIGANVPTLGEEADLEVQTFSLAIKPIESKNVQFSTKPSFLPNVCYNQCGF